MPHSDFLAWLSSATLTNFLYDQKMKQPEKWGQIILFSWLQNEDYLNENDLKNEDDLNNEDDLKDEDNLKNEGKLKNEG